MGQVGRGWCDREAVFMQYGSIFLHKHRRDSRAILPCAGSESSNPFKFVKSDDWGRGGPLLITSVTSSFSDFHRRIWLGFVQQGFSFDSFLPVSVRNNPGR